MRIAFTSCFSAQLFPQQDVWDEIAQHEPDVLLLLGDSIYLDYGGPYSASALRRCSAGEFAQHAHSRYRTLLAQPQFKALVQRPTLATYAIWDDHDFLWNGACGADVMADPALQPLVYPSRALFAAYRETLAQRLAPGSFPPTPPAWSDTTPAPGYSMVDLGHGVLLHLTDGRSYRQGKGRQAQLGTAQLDALQANMHAAPAGSTHVVASGTVFRACLGDNWHPCRQEYDRMLALAQQHNIYMLSGDIHHNRLARYPTQGARYLFEATSSGAAVRRWVVFGTMQRNYGLLTINDAQLHVELFKSGNRQDHGTVDRRTWQTIPTV